MHAPATTPARSRFLDIRSLRYHVRQWGPEPQALAADDAVLVMLHGWMDVSASFQFVVDAFARPRCVLAPDWRGFGLSANANADCYWFPDYLADLDQLLDALVGHRPVILVGHSMGGNIAMLYAGVRPQRVLAVINLEGVGLRDLGPEQAPARYAEWLDELRTPPTMRSYRSLQDVAARLIKTNPRLSADKAMYLAGHWSVPLGDASGEGGYRLAADPAHRIVNPVLYRWAEAEACWRAIRAPVLWVEGAQTDAHKWAGGVEESARRRSVLTQCEAVTVADAGHMLHHDQPHEVAQHIESFVDRVRANTPQG